MIKNNSEQRIFTWYEKYKKKKEKISDARWYPMVELCQNLLLAVLAVIPLMTKICQTVPFSYEVNDDATVAQILDGSYTGVPEAHAIFVRYPLSWIMQMLYRKNPAVSIGVWKLSNVNWYVGVIVILEVLALVAVLFRILNYFRKNRLLICFLFDLCFVMLWLPAFSDMTFSTAAAFFGCMGILFFTLESEEEAWRPWNLIILGIFIVSSWCLRKQCLYMVLPFLGLELILKYNVRFFKSVKPWVVFSFCGVLLAGVIFLNNQMYGSQDWKKYFLYNHERAYLQDYVGFPEYENATDLYQSLGINENGRNAMARYTYCLVDDFDTGWVEETYRYVKGQEEQLPLKEKMNNSKEKARKYLWDKSATNQSLKEYSFYVWFVLMPLLPVTVIFCREKKLWEHIRNILCIGGCGFFLYLEWIYLAMNGRFPQRVEEAIRLLMFCVGSMLVCKLLKQWEERPFTHVPVILQFVLLLCLCKTEVISQQIIDVKETQEYNLSYASEKTEVLSYCGANRENYYILDTLSFSKMSRPKDDLHQGNWFMSGSWAAYSPLYYKKLQSNGISTLGTEFLCRDNVFLITKGKKNISGILGLPDTREAEVEIVEELMTENNSFFEVYKIKGIKNAEK